MLSSTIVPTPVSLVMVIGPSSPPLALRSLTKKLLVPAGSALWGIVISIVSVVELAGKESTPLIWGM